MSHNITLHVTLCRGTVFMSIIHSIIYHSSDHIMELDTRSRCWIITFAVNDNTDESISVLGDGTLPLTRYNHAKWSKVNGACSVWLTFEHAQRCSAVTRAYSEGYGDVVIKRVTQTVYNQFMDIPCDNELRNVVHPTHDNTDVPGHTEVIDPPIIQAESGTDSDQELNKLVQRRRGLKRKLRELIVVQEQLSEINERIKNII